MAVRRCFWPNSSALSGPGRKPVARRDETRYGGARRIPEEGKSASQILASQQNATKLGCGNRNVRRAALISLGSANVVALLSPFGILAKAATKITISPSRPTGQSSASESWSPISSCPRRTRMHLHAAEGIAYSESGRLSDRQGPAAAKVGPFSTTTLSSRDLDNKNGRLGGEGKLRQGQVHVTVNSLRRPDLSGPFAANTLHSVRRRLGDAKGVSRPPKRHFPPRRFVACMSRRGNMNNLPRRPLGYQTGRRGEHGTNDE